MLPNFLIVGAIKGGTTSLCRYFREHPDIYMSPVKEPRYFCYDAQDPEHVKKPFNTFPVRTEQKYEELFSSVKGEKAIGEASPQYLRSPIAAGRIKAKIPAARIIVSLRNPIDRAYSEYIMAVRAGNERQPLSHYFADPMRLQFSCYYAHLQRFYQQFPREQIKVVLLEDLQNEPLSVVQALFEFLHVDSDYAPELGAQHNPGGLPQRPWLHRLLEVKSKRVKWALKPLVPKSLLEWRLHVKNTNLAPAPRLSQSEREQLWQHFSEDIKQLEDLVARDLGVWRPGTC